MAKKKKKNVSFNSFLWGVVSWQNYFISSQFCAQHWQHHIVDAYSVISSASREHVIVWMKEMKELADCRPPRFTENLMEWNIRRK